MSVDLCGTHVGVTEQLLDRPQIGSALEQVRCVGVPQGVRMQGPTVGQRMAGEDPPGVPGGRAVATGVHEQRRAGCRGAATAGRP